MTNSRIFIFFRHKTDKTVKTIKIGGEKPANRRLFGGKRLRAATT